jgi:hypothetical protein
LHGEYQPVIFGSDFYRKLKFTIMELPRIEIKAYRKYDLRRLLVNPSLNLEDEAAVNKAVPMPWRKWNELMKPLKKKHRDCMTAHILTEDQVRMLMSNGNGNGKNGRKR